MRPSMLIRANYLCIPLYVLLKSPFPDLSASPFNQNLQNNWFNTHTGSVTSLPQFNMSHFNTTPNNSFNVQTLQRQPMPPMNLNMSDGVPPPPRRNISTSVFNLHQQIPNPPRIGTIHPGFPGYNSNAWPTMQQV